jgi:hypothetical protein
MPTFDPTNIDKTVSFANSDSDAYRTVFMKLPAVANAAGSGAGASVATVVTFDPPLPNDATNITVHVTPKQDAVPFANAPTVSGFTFTLNPRLAANTLSASTNDILVSWDI